MGAWHSREKDALEVVVIDSIQRQVAQMFQASVAASAGPSAAGPEAQPSAQVRLERPAPERAAGTGQDVLSSAAAMTALPSGLAAKAGSAPLSQPSGKDGADDGSSRDGESRSGASPGDSSRAAKAYAATSSQTSPAKGIELTV